MTDGRTGEFAGKVAIIIGAALSIGAAMVKGPAEPGAEVLLGHKNVEGPHLLAQRLRAEGRGARAVATQVRRGGDKCRLVETKLGEFGGLQVQSATKVLRVALLRAISLAWAPYGLGACAVDPVATDATMLPPFHRRWAQAVATARCPGPSARWRHSGGLRDRGISPTASPSMRARAPR